MKKLTVYPLLFIMDDMNVWEAHLHPYNQRENVGPLKSFSASLLPQDYNLQGEVVISLNVFDMFEKLMVAWKHNDEYLADRVSICF